MDVDIIHLDEEEIMKNIRDNTTEACNNSNENRTNDENRIFDKNNSTENDSVKDSDNDSSNLPPMQAFIENNLELGLYQQLSELEDKWLG
jgi:cobalamin-dependent methionine synthase I